LDGIRPVLMPTAGVRPLLRGQAVAAADACSHRSQQRPRQFESV